MPPRRWNIGLPDPSDAVSDAEYAHRHSQYWNIGYGAAPGEVADDAEGLQTMRTLADNLAYMLKQFATGEAAVPERERGVHTNFIR